MKNDRESCYNIIIYVKNISENFEGDPETTVKTVLAVTKLHIYKTQKKLTTLSQDLSVLNTKVVLL